MTLLRLVFLSALTSWAVGSWSHDAPLVDTVASNVHHIEDCLATGKYAEAQAYAEMTLFTRPVRYSVENDPDGVAREAFDIWQQTLGGDVTFVESPANLADLQIEFKSSLHVSGRDVMGLATTRRSVTPWSGGYFTYRVTGSLEVAVCAPDRSPASRATVLNVALHEIGHYLGLDDVNAHGDVMAPIDLAHPVTTPSAGDMQNLAAIRDQASLMLQQAQQQAAAVGIGGEQP